MAGQPQDHFSEVAPDYATFRPHYPDQLYQWLDEIVPGHSLAWDVGTGNGQAAVALATRFERVVATDFSAGQIESARPHPRVEYRVRPAEESGLDRASVDLVTVAQALHWFDTETFFAEVNRVLVPSGVIVAWTYGVVQAEDARIDPLLHQFYYRDVGPWWPENRRMVEEGYRMIRFPFERLAPPALAMTVGWNLDQLIGYIGTWSAVSRYRSDQGNDPVPPLRSRLAALWGNPLSTREIYWPLSLLAGRKRPPR